MEKRGVEGMGGREKGRGEAGKDGTVGNSREAKKIPHAHFQNHVFWWVMAFHGLRGVGGQESQHVHRAANFSTCLQKRRETKISA